MANELPSYIRAVRPHPNDKRVPWYKSIAPSYAGAVFLSVPAFATVALVLPYTDLGAALLGLLISALICFGLYYVSAMWGMQTGYPLYIVGTSTFGTVGGYLFPGLFMGLLQIGWYGVTTYFSAIFICQTFGWEAAPLSVPFTLVGVGWGLAFAFFAIRGLKYVAAISTYLPIVPLAMIAGAAWRGWPGLADFTPWEADQLKGTLLLIDLIVGYSASAMAAGADFARETRHAGDVWKGGLTGISLACFVTGALSYVALAGVNSQHPGAHITDFPAAIQALGGFLAATMALLFALSSTSPTAFVGFLIGNSLSTMIPPLGRERATLAGVVVGIILAVTGWAGQLGAFFGLVGASFGPIIGAMTADYLLIGGRWPGPRRGISLPGYAAWVLGFVVGILPNPMLGSGLHYAPAGLYAVLVGFVVYLVLAKAGLETEGGDNPHSRLTV